MKQRLKQLLTNHTPGFLLHRRAGGDAALQDSYNAFESSGDEVSLKSGSLDGLSAHSNDKSHHPNYFHDIPTVDQIDQTTHIAFGNNKKNSKNIKPHEEDRDDHDHDHEEEDPTEEPTEQDEDEDDEGADLSVTLVRETNNTSTTRPEATAILKVGTPPRHHHHHHDHHHHHRQQGKLPTRPRRSPRAKRRGGRRRVPLETRERLVQVLEEEKEQQQKQKQKDKQEGTTTEDRNDNSNQRREEKHSTSDNSVKKNGVLDKEPDKFNKDHDHQEEEEETEFFHFDASQSTSIDHSTTRAGLLHQSKQHATSFQHRRQRHTLFERQLSFPHQQIHVNNTAEGPRCNHPRIRIG